MFINNLKTTSAGRARDRFAQHIPAFCTKPLLWHRPYFVGDGGDVTLKPVGACVDARGAEEHTRKALAKAKSKIKLPA